jgi:hypothetical protein
VIVEKHGLASEKLKVLAQEEKPLIEKAWWHVEHLKVISGHQKLSLRCLVSNDV